MPASTAAWIDGPSASASGMLTTSPSGCEATAASIRSLIATMSNVSGAWYSTVTPMSSAAASTPLAATDQNGSDACPCVTTTNRKSRCVTAPSPFPSPSPSPLSSPVHAVATRANTNTSMANLFTIEPTPFSPGPRPVIWDYLPVEAPTSSHARSRNARLRLACRSGPDPGSGS